MQDFQDDKKKKRPPVSHFLFRFCKICHGLSLCYILFHIPWSSFFALFLSYWVFKYHKITPIQNGRQTAILRSFAHKR